MTVTELASLVDHITFYIVTTARLLVKIRFAQNLMSRMSVKNVISPMSLTTTMCVSFLEMRPIGMRPMGMRPMGMRP